MLRFLPILASSEVSPLENSVKYFLIQRMASIIFIMAVLGMSFNYTRVVEILIVMVLLLKLGAVPFHGWFLSLVKTVNIYVIFLLSTIQKIIPLVIMRILNYWIRIIFFVSIISFMVTLFLGLSLLRFFKILALSRINNLVWILISIFRGFQYLALYFFIYAWLFLGIYLVFCETNKRIFHHIQMTTTINKLYTIFILISIGGLPPIVGFLGKVSVIKVTLMTVNRIFIIFLLFSSLFILFLYIRFRYLAVSFSPFIPETPSKNFSLSKNTFYIVRVIAVWPVLVL